VLASRQTGCHACWLAGNQRGLVSSQRAGVHAHPVPYPPPVPAPRGYKQLGPRLTARGMSSPPNLP
jgi:hypothetical protein